MLKGKRNRRLNPKYSDFVQIPLIKRKQHHDDDKAECDTDKEIQELEEYETNIVPDSDDAVAEKISSFKDEGSVVEPFVLQVLPQLLSVCPHHDVLVTTSDHALVSCHALVLSQASPLLAQLLRDQESMVDEEGGMVRLVLENMNKEQLSCLLEFVYTGQTRAALTLDLIDRFTELDIVFSVEACGDFKDENMETEDFKVDDEDEILQNLLDKVQHVTDIKERKTTIVQTLAFSENKENEKSYGLKVCDFCCSEFKTFLLLKRHVRDHHASQYDQFLHSFGLLERFMCEFGCFKGFKTSFQLRTHVLSMHKNEWDKFCGMYRNHDCCKCDKIFFTRTELSKHERRVHKHFRQKMLPNGKHLSGRPISINIEDGLPVNHERTCDVCKKVFSNSDRFTDHMNEHMMGKKPYSCEFCDYKSSSRKSLGKHSVLHIVPETPLLCNTCGNVFSSQYDLRKHMKKAHSIRQRLLDKKPKSVGDFICEKCGQHFTDQKKYNSHIKFSHISEDDKLQCPHCPHKSITSFSLKMHLALHFPPTIPCEQCGKLFHTKLYLTRHIKQNHAQESEKDFQCAQCGKGFVTRDSYEGHLSMHAGVKPIKCRYCDMRYQNKSNAIAHEKKAHKDLYTRKAKTLGGVRVKDRMEGKEIIGLNKGPTDSSDQPMFYLVDDE